MKQIILLASLAWLPMGCANAQNSEFAVLFGFSQRDASLRNDVIRGEVQASMQFNYARQWKEWGKSRLYFEFPVAMVAGSKGELGERVNGRAGATVFVTPGLRYRYNLSTRVAVFVAIGVGAAFSGERLGNPVNGVIVERDRRYASPAAQAGVGIDFRLARSLSLRAEARDFRATRDTRIPGRNTAGQLGLVWHF